ANVRTSTLVMRRWQTDVKARGRLVAAAAARPEAGRGSQMTSAQTSAAPAGERRRDADRTRTEILEVATEGCAQRGDDGARVDESGARTRSTKRMISSYFGGKKQLYLAVLQGAYARIRAAEQEVNVDHLDPVEAIRQLAEVPFDHHEAHPD